MDNDRTRSLYASLITKPTLTDQLLNRPPFKFLLDIFANTITKTGFLKDQIDPSELDASKFTDKNDKAAALDRIIDAVNDDGALDSVKSAKILAGKEPELTSLLLQRFAERAASGGTQPSSGSAKKEKDNERSISKDRKSNGEKEKKKSSKDEKEKKDKKQKGKDEKKDKDRKSSDRDKDDKKEKKERKEKKEKRKESDEKEKKEKKERKEEREEKKEERERRQSVVHAAGVDSLVMEEDDHTQETDGFSNGHHEVNEMHTVEEDTGPRPPPPAERERLLRQSTGAARPQTSLGRPGTAAARAAPPKLRKKHVATIEPRQADITDAVADIIPDTGDAPFQAEETFIEEVDENVPEYAEEEEVPEDEGERGGLVNKIIGTRNEIEESAMEGEQLEEKDDDGEIARQRIQVNQLQENLQLITRTAYPLARLFDFAQEDYENMVRELDKWRMEGRRFEQQLNDAKAQSNFDSHQEAARLKSLSEEIREIRTQLISTKARIAENDDEIRVIIGNM